MEHGVLVKNRRCVRFIEDLYRPWPRCRYNEGPSRLYYTHLEKHKEAERAELRAFQTKSDIEIYKPILIEVLNLFGTAIHTSLERTLGEYLRATDGIFRNELRPDWQLEKVSRLLCTNNPAERPFAVAKGMYVQLSAPPI